MLISEGRKRDEAGGGWWGGWTGSKEVFVKRSQLEEVKFGEQQNTHVSHYPLLTIHHNTWGGTHEGESVLVFTHGSDAYMTDTVIYCYSNPRKSQTAVKHVMSLD